MSRLRIAAPVLVAAFFGIAAAAQSSFVIQGDYKIGGYAVKADGSLGGAVDEFGAPTTRRRARGIGCDLTWRSLGLRIEFYNLGGRDACSREGGRFGGATITSRQWRTSKGLRVGDSVARIRRLYPRATFHQGGFYPGSWWLVTRYTRIGTNRYYPGLRAVVRSGRVSALVIEYAAGGD
jgi:hypothetical protein